MENKIMQEEIKKLRKKYEVYAKSAGIKLNPDKKIVNAILIGLLKNKEKHGEIYCPCRVVTGNKQKDKDIICPCIYHMQEIKKDERCMCGLFVK